MEHNKGKCKVCGHGMIEHGVDYAYRGYCANGNNGDCKCKVKGLSYDEALNEL